MLMKSLSNKKDSLSLAIRGIQPPYQGVEVFRQWLTLNGALEKGLKNAGISQVLYKYT